MRDLDSRDGGAIPSYLTMDKKSKQLGLNHSTANYHLQRMILMHLVKKTGMDTCFRCNKKINNYKDISIEHKKPWIDTDIGLYWDLQNIAFSHKSCNYSCGRRNKIINPPGEEWCYKCKNSKKISEFPPSVLKRRRICKKCFNTYRKDLRKRKKML